MDPNTPDSTGSGGTSNVKGEAIAPDTGSELRDEVSRVVSKRGKSQTLERRRQSAMLCKGQEGNGLVGFSN